MGVYLCFTQVYPFFCLLFLFELMTSKGHFDATLKPPLKWAGGKRWLLPVLKRYWSKHQQSRLVEPFCGGLSVALGLAPDRALLNDVNPALINFYQHLSEGLEVDISFINDESAYYHCRDEFNQLNAKQNNPARAAQLFYYLNRTGYNGLCRFNSSGGYNVPFGRYKTINYLESFIDYQPILSRWQFSCQDFETIPLESMDFVYADPPYDTPFHQYSQKGFKWEDQERLALWLSQHDGPVLLSNQATDRIIDLYRQLGFRLRYLDAPRLISCKGNGRKAVKEVLAIHGF
ncbi:site-specific DNA-methyltransferase (adenine-specific) [Methylophaga thalassica]|uniref:Site-specific DNA-methyltransferase (adenine-specific) n=2 Tax=Methylophaga thalassica TaxID=40223 RepID=A0ABQ5TUJ4_9GAMM|nr:site-specific DNA-methyltransferase (adenine-specific) [Methylophaga thalassica]